MKVFSIFYFLLILSVIGCTTSKVPFQTGDIDLIAAVFAENQKIHEGMLKEPPKLDFKSYYASIESLSKSKDERILNWQKRLLEQFPKNAKDLDTTFDQIAQMAVILLEIKHEVSLPVEYKKFYCPMVDKYWVSSDKFVRNPYASEMRDCGEQVTEE
jgi:hypothetical protein